MPCIVIDEVTSDVITRSEALELTARIRGAAEELWSLLLEARDRKAWQVLGYPSMADYAKAEFGMSQSYAYRIWHQGRVIRALEAASNSPVGESITENVARQIPPQSVDAAAGDVKLLIDAGSEPTDAVNAVIDKARAGDYSESRKKKDQSNRIVARLTYNVDDLLVCTGHLNFAQLDPSVARRCAAALRAKAREMVRFAEKLESEASRA
jgi:hypothetical protein